jgi:hypothetical protein
MRRDVMAHRVVGISVKAPATAEYQDDRAAITRRNQRASVANRCFACMATRAISAWQRSHVVLCNKPIVNRKVRVAPWDRSEPRSLTAKAGFFGESDVLRKDFHMLLLN